MLGHAWTLFTVLSGLGLHTGVPALALQPRRLYVNSKGKGADSEPPIRSIPQQLGYTTGPMQLYANRGQNL